jgi:hypothetical protein
MNATPEQCRAIWQAMKDADFTPQWASHLSFDEASIVLAKFKQLAEGGTEHDNHLHRRSSDRARAHARHDQR